MVSTKLTLNMITFNMFFNFQREVQTAVVNHFYTHIDNSSKIAEFGVWHK